MIRAGAIAMYDIAASIKGQTYTRLHTCNVAQHSIERHTDARNLMHIRSHLPVHTSYIRVITKEGKEEKNFANYFDQEYNNMCAH